MIPRKFLTIENHQEVDALFDQLHACDDPEEIHDLFQEISDLWLEHTDQSIRRQMALVMECVIEEEAQMGLKLLQKVLIKAPQYPEAYHLKGTCHFLHGQYKDANTCYEQCLALEPRHFGALSGLISVCFLMGDDRKALKLMQRLRSITPHNEALHDQIALTRDIVMDIDQ